MEKFISLVYIIHLMGRKVSKIRHLRLNQQALNSLVTALANGEKVTGADGVYYTHEIKEAQLVSSGISQENAHRMALEYYEVSPFSTYHPDVIKMVPELWNINWFEFWDIER